MGKDKRGASLAMTAIVTGVAVGFAPKQHRTNWQRRVNPVNMAGIDVHDAVVNAQHMVEPLASTIAQHVVEPLASTMRDAVSNSPLASKVHDMVIHTAQHGHGISSFSPASSKLLNSYGDLLHDHPLSTKSATAACLAAAGDAVAQTKATGSAQKYDATRGASFVLFAAAYTGAFQHYWFGYLNSNLAFTAASLSPTLAVLFASPASPSILAASKLCINQFIVVPTVYMPLFFLVTGAMAGLNFEDGLARAKDLYPQLLARNWAFWLPAQFVQFSYIAPEWQVPYLCVAGLLWSIILSSVGGATASTNSQQADTPALEVLVTDTVTLTDVGDAIVDATSDVADALIDSSNVVADAVEEVATDAASYVSDALTDAVPER